MAYPKLSGEEITQRGRELYENSIRPQVETTQNIGKIISINVETGEYEIGDDLIITSRRLQAKYLRKNIYIIARSPNPWDCFVPRNDKCIFNFARLLKQADAPIWAGRIGFNAVYAVGGTLISQKRVNQHQHYPFSRCSLKNANISS